VVGVPHHGGPKLLCQQMGSSVHQDRLPSLSPLEDSDSPLGPVNGALSALGSADALRYRLLNTKCRSYLSFRKLLSSFSLI
jgi:hypothetical protein